MVMLIWLATIVSTVCVILWLHFYRKGAKRYESLLLTVDSEIFRLRSLYGIGLSAMESYESITGKKLTQTEKAVVKIKELAEVYGRDSAELYFYIYRAAQITLVLTFVPIGLAIGCMMGTPLGFLAGAGISYVMIFGIQSGISGAMKSKKEDIITEFPQMVSKLTLLINAGMQVRRAWDEVAQSDPSKAIYKEMIATSVDIREGASIADAMESFADRCALKEIRKFSSIYVQAVNRGAGEAIKSLKVMATEAWEQKRQLAKQKGEIASQKLLIPNMFMFLGILVIVVVPMVASMLGAI